MEKAKAARDSIRAQFQLPAVESVGIAADRAGWYVVVVTTQPVPSLPLRYDGIRVRQISKADYLLGNFTLDAD